MSVPNPSSLDPHDVLLVALAAIAGWMDALSFSDLGQVFTSFQSGNFIFLGLAVDQGDTERLLGAAVSLAAFFAGTALGAYVVGRADVGPHAVRHLLPAFALELAVLILFAVCWQVFGSPGADSTLRLLLVGLAAVAMGVQGAAVFALRIPGVVTNAMTATLMLGGVLAGLRARGERAAQSASPVSPIFIGAMCAAYVLSALVVGAIGRPDLAAVVPAAALALCFAALNVRRPVIASPAHSSGRSS